MSTVAVLGMGRMGSAMARALARDGTPLVLYNRTPDRALAVAAEIGARVVDTPASAAREADICLTMLADRDAVDATWDGPDGLLAGARPGTVLVDLSTVPPSTLRAHADRAAAAGAAILDAPVSGSVPLAESGQLTIMVGGETDAFERARPILERLASKVFHIGPLGSGAAIKLTVNILIFGLNHAVSEALVLAERAGIDRATAYEVFTASAAGAPYVGYKQAAFVEPEETPVAFTLDLTAKDLRLILELADDVGAPIPQARLDAEVIAAASARLGPMADLSSIATYLRAMAAEGRPT